MTRLILTADASAAGGLQRAGHADIAIPVEPRLVWGPLPSDAELMTRFAPRTTQKPDLHWLEAAAVAWRAYRQPTPQDWSGLLDKDTSALPQLRQAVLELLEELPMPATGLGATEIRILELVSVGNASPSDVFPGYEKPNTRRVFGDMEVVALLDGLARSPAPAVSGLNEGPFTEEMHRDKARFERYKQSRLSLTALGKAVLAQTEDFSRHNPIRRWWGGTQLTSENLWRWDATNRALIAP